MALEEVKRIDPDGDYSFTHSNWLDFTQMSYHYLPDGNTYVISYLEGIIAAADEFS